METDCDVIIIGAGPAGLAVGLYTSRARLRTLLLEKETMGGELVRRLLWPGRGIRALPKRWRLPESLPR